MQPQQAQIHKEQRGGGLSTNPVSSNASSQASSIAPQDLGIRLAAASNTRAANQRATTRAGSKRANQKATRKAATQRATAQSKSKAQERKEARNQEFGLMPSELDNTNHNVFHADASAIRGARDTESALRYLPFVTIINTAGFGQQFDLRGQGRLSSNGVKMYINGVPANPVDSYFNPMPIATLIPSLIDDVSVTPGGGAVLYGSGAKGGTINVVNSKRSAPFFLVGAGYVNTMATKGNSFNAYARAAENLSPHIKVNAGLGFNQIGGPREDDSLTQGEAIVGGWYDIGWGQSVSADIDVFYGKTKTTPYNSLMNGDSIRWIMLNHSALKDKGNGQGDAALFWEAARYVCLSGTVSNPHIDGTTPCDQDLYDFTPSKDNRGEKGNGDIQTTTIRATGKLGWESQLTQRLKVNVDGFYSLYQTKYDTYQMNLPYFVLGYVNPQNPLAERGYNWFLPRPTDQKNSGDLYLWNDASTTGIDLSDGQRSDWHFFDQSGSTFSDTKFGLNAKVDWLHDSGEFIFGISSHYEMSNKKQKSHLRQAIADGSLWGKPKRDAVSSAEFRTLIVDIDDKTDIKTFTNSVFLLENYRLNRMFSVMAGMRYEMKNYDISVRDEFAGQKLQFQNNTGNNNNEVNFKNYSVTATKDRAFEDSYNENFDNFTFELAPVLHYSNTGALYVRGELGYIAPPAWAMLQRIGVVTGAKQQPDIFKNDLDFNFAWLRTNLKSETYYTAELGWKETIGTRRVPLLITNLTLNALLFSANIFYTNSQNEFYFTGDTWSGMTLGTYDNTRRMGAEVALEQYLFDGALGFNESFTYIKAQQKTADGEWKTIPYTYDYKATLGANVNITSWLEVVDVSVNVWLQNSIYGNQNIYSTKMEVGSPTPQTGGDLFFKLLEQDDVKLKPYIISDFGISVGLNKNMGVVSVGIKNLFDTFYYDYYNNDRSAVVNENRYVIGRGRTVFVEGTFRY